MYYKNHNPTDIRRWLRVKFIKRLSTNIFQVSLGGRLFSAHRQQLRLAEGPLDRNATRILIDRTSPERPVNQDFESTSQQQQATQSDDEDFYGFVSDSILFEAPVQSWSTNSPSNPAEIENSEQHQQEIDSERRSRALKRKHSETPVVRRSKRSKVSSRSKDFVYY